MMKKNGNLSETSEGQLFTDAVQNQNCHCNKMGACTNVW